MPVRSTRPPHPAPSCPRAALLVVAVVVWVLALPGGALAQGGVPSDVPYATSPQHGIGNQYSAPFQWWTVALEAGDVLTADLVVTSQPDDEVFLFLYLPGTTHKSQNTRVATAPFRTTASETGEYLFCVFSFSREGTAYTFTWSIE